jgi:hypothetical protein
MPLRVKIQDIVEAIDLPNRDWRSYVNRETGEIVTVAEGTVIGPDGELDPEDIEQADGFLMLPTSEEIHEWGIMEEFARGRARPQADDLLEALDGRGAFRMFRSTIRRLGMEDEWDRVRQVAFASIARQWLDEHEIEYE